MRHDGRGSGGDRILSSVWYISMTIPAGFACTNLSHHIVDPTRGHKLCIELSVAANTIIHNDLRTGRVSLDHLWLGIGEEDVDMAHTISGFHGPLSHKVFVRDMTVIASCIASV